MDPLVGQLLDRRYRVRRRVARGGMATVYEAVDVRLDRTVALKVMHPGLAEDPEFVARFIREAQSAARLSHPNVVAVYDQGDDGDAVFLAMEYVEGRTLRAVLRERGRLSVRETLDVLEPLLAALGAAHQAGLVHRDVKPENILLADDGRAKVADFGLARAVSTTTATSTGVLIGTVSYLSPEQVARGIADARSDVYSAGIVAFELITGTKPHAGDSPIQVAYQHVHDDVPPPSSRRPGLPAEIDDLVLRATARDPDRRPADANRMLTELLRARQSLSEEQLDAPDPDATTRLVGLRPGEVGGGRDRSGDTAVTRVSTATAVVPRDQPPASDPYAAPPRPPRRRRGGVLALLLVFLLAAGAGAGAWWLGSGGYARVPSLVGLTESQARAQAAARGLSVEVGPGAYSEKRAPGQVLSTDPAAGERTRRDSAIVLVLSRGPERHDVPALRGAARQQAEHTLAASSLKVGRVSRAYDDVVPSGHVVATIPAEGTALPRGGAVALVLSKGVQPVPVPDVTGQPYAVAQAALTNVGFEVERSGEAYSDSVEQGAVISQRPAHGKARKGSTVRLVVSKGPHLYPVPRVTGQPVAQAQQTLTDAGFLVVVRRLPGGPGIVLAQSPPGDSQAPHGSTVTLSAF